MAKAVIKLLAVTFVFQLMFSVISSSDIKVYEFTRNESLSFAGKKLVGHVLEVFSTKHQVIHCAYECLKMTRCRSFNYEQKYAMCELNDGDHVEFGDSLVDTVNDTLTEYHHRNAFYIDEEALGPCAKDPCQNGGRCLDTVNYLRERTYFCICADGWMGDNCEVEMNRIDWGEWEDWGTCSVSCETGWQSRRRHCMDMVTKETLPSTKCWGRDVEYQSCTRQACPRWNNWEEWGECSTFDTCGKGVKHRSRTCANGGTPGHDRYCLGFTNETAPCSGINCWGMLQIKNSNMHGEGRIEIVDDVIGTEMAICKENWEPYMEDIVCKQIGFEGVGEDDNSTFATSLLPEGTPMYKLQCTGDEKSIQMCKRHLATSCTELAGMHCRVRGGWSLWSGWGDCSVTCENGTRTRTRACNHPPPNFGGTQCPGEDLQYKPCTLPMCPIDGVWTAWAQWSECDVTCAYGTRFRTRTCTGPFYGGAECPGSDNDAEECFSKMCPVDGVWNTWVAWSSCSHSCGYGSRNRSRTCDGPFYNGAECPGSPSEIETCNAFSCPVDGSWDLWTAWEECSRTCGGGTRIRTRDCNDPLHGGAGCTGPSNQTETCNDFNCPIDGVFTDWEPWSECSVTCANGTRTRERTCYGPYYGGSNCTGVYDETEVCVTAECPVDGVWENWQSWQTCNVTCGGGTMLRVRSCNGPFYGGLECAGPAEDRNECNTHECPIDGFWNQWADWQLCNVTCGGGYQIRTRDCNQPQHGGADCSGDDTDSQTCNTHPCPVDGEWDNWAAWSMCNVTCGGGMTSRERTCHQPLHGGMTCEGEGEETKTCNTQECPVDGVWKAWSNWTECSQTCGAGKQDRDRICEGPYFGGADCYGDANQTQTCNDFPCPIDGIFADWTEWSTCTRSCGNGEMTRNRICFGPYYGGAPCDGDYSETVYCNPSNCPVNGVWFPWTAWSECTTSCENGTRYRNRTCDGPFAGGLDCPGEAEETEDCFLMWCPVDGVWESWSNWTACPVTCGGSIQNRTRDCIGPFHNGSECDGPYEEFQDCNTYPCPVDGEWSWWSVWTVCNVTCGGGTSGRFRYCSDSSHGGSNCTGPKEEYKDCNEHECPVDGVFEAWSNWTECSHSCGTGERHRYRNCTGPFYGGAECDGNWNQTENCNTHYCPISQWGPWKVWSFCTVSCGGGVQLRARICMTDATSGLPCEGDQQEIRSCNTHACPVDGVWEEWAEWNGCNVSCGGGTKWRERNCTGPFYGGAECPGANFSVTECNTHECPIDCVWEMWSAWGTCSVTCGGGDQSRDRNTTGPFYGGAECIGPGNQTQECNTHECPVDGVLSEWSEWYMCDVTCGGGTQWRNRTCIGPFHGGANCTDSLDNSRDCNTHECPIDGVYLDWSAWETCDVTCGGGIQWRNRTCDGPFYGGADCVGPEMQNQTCNTIPCPVDGVWEQWTDWDECSVTCGGSEHSRYRTCIGPFHDGANCSGPNLETRDCGTINCPVDGVFTDWSGWGECEITCGGGIQWRNRSCEGPFFGGADCAGPLNNSQECNTQECPIDGVWDPWTEWGDCSVTCGGGEQIRTRVCQGPFHGGADCDGPGDDSKICNTNLCPIPGDWFEWAEWSLCTTTCGGGTRYRNRTCDFESYGNLTTDCEGLAEENVDCHTFSCTPLAIHCADWATRGLNQSCIADVDPDGDGLDFGSVQVECDFDSEPGKAITVLHHNHENRTQVRGYEGAGEYQIMLEYDVGWAEAIRIVDSSAECAQFMRWDCLAAIIHNPFNPEMLTTYWMNRTEQVTNYFGGASPGSGNCACGETNSCFNSSLPCNCDENDEVWRFDEGFVTNRPELPIHSFYAGDTGKIREVGIITVGKVRCAGFDEDL